MICGESAVSCLGSRVSCNGVTRLVGYRNEVSRVFINDQSSSSTPSDPVEEAKRRIRIDPLTDNVDDDSDEEDDLVVYGDATALPLPDKMDPSHQSPDIPGDPPPPPPPQPDEAPPPPPPPVDRPYRKWWELPPPRPLPPTGPNDRRDQSVGGPRTRRWAWYDTDMFSSERLRPYDTIRHVPLSIALPMRLDQTPTRRR